MKLEHIALNVADPVALADWYCRNLGFTIAKKVETAPFMHFLRDPSGMMLEIYLNPPGQVPDYASMDPLLMHIAFASENLPVDRDALVAAGATLVFEQTLADGSLIGMFRDPWGIAIQLVQRTPGFFQ